MTVGPERGYDQENSHSRKQKNTCPGEFLPVLQKEEEYHCSHIGKPQKIRNHKHLTEGNVVIRAHMDESIIFLAALFKPCKPPKINGHVNYEGNSVLILHI